jgi:DnaJ-class molecular chaperone
MDHYETLGVDKNSTQESIKRAYRQLAKQHHPDNGGDTEKFKQINQAYSIIGDEHKRHQYNQDIASRRSNNNSYNYNHDNIHDFFNDVFKSSSGFHHSYHTQPKNKDLRTTLHINLESVLHPQSKTVHLNRGRSNKTVQVDIPAGVNDGATIRYKGYGQDVRTVVPPGDLLVTIQVNPHKKFTRDYNNLYSTIEIDAIDAMLGTSAEFKNIDNSKILVKIPAGAQPGQQLRIANKGLPNNNTGIIGNLILTIKIKIPCDLNDQQKELLSQIKDQNKSQ